MISLREYILSNIVANNSIFEQAFTRTEFLLRLDNLIGQILENWGLIEYARKDASYEEYVSGWKKELRAHCNNVNSKRIKGGNREKAIKYKIISTLELNNWEVVYDYIKEKFEKENISLFDAKEIAKDLSENIEELVNALAYRKIDEWIESL